jgi:NodT family efflux transporter outer membrane factor (OMF) lipoprotein
MTAAIALQARPERRLIRSTLAVALTVVLGACTTLGPDYHLPPEAIASQPKAGAPFAEAKGTPFSSAPLPLYWWRLYHDARLDGLVQQALTHNTDLRQALANLERERAAEAGVAGMGRPTIGVEGGPSFGHVSGASLLAADYSPPNSWYYGVSASLSYQIDMFGQIRRAIEASKASGDAAQAAVDLARINVAAATTRAYADICSTGLRLRSADQSVQLQQESLDISERLQRAGRVGALDATRSRAQLQQLKAAIPPLQARQQAALYRLATLTGALPQDFPRDVATCNTPPQVTGALPTGDGAALLRRRPDIRQAERNLAAATANIGVVTADLYPHITLGLSTSSASLGSDFGGKDSFSWMAGPLISWTIPNTGAVQSRIAQSEASTRGALAKFDGTVLNALRETETALNAYARELDRHASLQAARDQSAIAAGQAQMLYQSGRTGLLDALDAKRALATNEAGLAASSAELVDDQVVLFLALGGGWEQETDTPPR